MEKKLTVVVVDDSPIFCDRITSLLMEIPETDQVHFAHTFKAGLQLIENKQPEVILLDINLPDGNGFEFLQTIKSKDLPTKLLIMMTEDASEEKKKKSLKLGADHFLSKFTEFEKIVEIIQSFDF